MPLRIVLCISLLAASACGGAARVDPSPAPTGDPTAGLTVPAGPVLLEPEQLIYPPEDFPLAGAAVARDAPIAAHAWERQFALQSSPDFRWFVVRLYVLEPDIPSSKFVSDNDCASISWDGEKPLVEQIGSPPRAGDGSRACSYRFADGQRVLYYMTGYRNVGVVVGTQPRREEMTDGLALDWIASLARRQIAIIGGVLAGSSAGR